MGRAEARDLGLDGGTLYDPTVNYRRVRGIDQRLGERSQAAAGRADHGGVPSPTKAVLPPVPTGAAIPTSPTSPPQSRVTRPPN
jgi:outer membrane protein